MRPLPCVLLLLCGLLPAVESGPTSDEASRTFLTALADSPHVRALLAERQALRHLEGTAGRLPDPMLGIGYARKRTPMETMPMYEVMLEQPIPRWGERDAARTMAAAATRMGDAEIAIEVAMLAADIAMALAELDGLAAEITESEAEAARVTIFTTALEARMATGDAGVLDRLALDTRRERLRLRIEDLRRQQDDRAADIRGRLGLAPTAALPAFTAPSPDAIDPSRTPLVLAAEARRLEALGQLQEARAMGRPETAIGLRAEREDGEDGNEDTIGVTLSVSLPVARGAISSSEDAAHARLRAAERQAEAARWRTTAAIDAARRALAQATRAEDLARTLVNRAQQEHQTVTTALASGGADLGEVFMLHDRFAELRLAVIEARVKARQAQAVLWTHIIAKLPTREATP